MKKFTGYPKVMLFRKGMVILSINMIRISVLRILLYGPKFTLTNAVIKYFCNLSDGPLIVSTNPCKKFQCSTGVGSAHETRFDFYYTTVNGNSFY